jgi:DNA-binding transcriptional MerR regulator
MDSEKWEKMYSVKEVAAMFGVSPDTILRMIRRGYLKAWRLPQPSNKRKRVYAVYRIPDGEARRVFKTYFALAS